MPSDLTFKSVGALNNGKRTRLVFEDENGNYAHADLSPKQAAGLIRQVAQVTELFTEDDDA